MLGTPEAAGKLPHLCPTSESTPEGDLEYYDPDQEIPAESPAGDGGFPDSRFRPSRESGIPSPFPGQIGDGGNGNWGVSGSDMTPEQS
jgi:hypothetical protein